MKPYPAYKPSGVQWLGDVPEFWSLLRVKEVATVLPSNIDKLTVEGEQPVLLCNYVDVYKNDKITADIEFMPATATDEQIRKLSLAKGDVVLTKDSESPWDIAVPTFIAEDIPNLVCGYHLAKLAPNVSLMRGDFLCWALKAFPVSVHFSLAASGITRYGLSIANISDGNIPVPSLAEQQSIATYLDHETARIDTLIAEKVRLIETLREYRQATISEVVTQGLDHAAPKKPSGVPWLGEVPAHWSIEKLKFFVRFVGGGTPSKDNDEYWGGDIPWVSPKDMKRPRIDDTEDKITEDAVGSSACTMIATGAVLVVVRSGILQHTIPIAINDVPVAVNQDMKALIPEERVQSSFLAYQIQGCQRELREDWVKQGATVESVEQQRMADSRFAIPPLDEQDAIATYLDRETARIDKLLAHVQDEIKLLQELRAATITDAVTGKIKVS